MEKRGYGDHDFDSSSRLLLCGDIESNPGPDTEEIMQTLLRMEKKYDAGQKEIKVMQGKILDRLTNLEKEMETMKKDLESSKEVIALTKEKVSEVGEQVHHNFCHGQDLQFLIDKHEQYSRKNSIRIRDVKEERDEDIEAVTINVLKSELNLDIEPREIDIVHRVGRFDKKPRAILVKFMSHKSKEKIMRVKKNCKNIKIHEDLAPGIKKIFDQLSFGRRLYDIESVWTIDGRIKYRLFGNSRVFEIRSYADLDTLINKNQ